ncbi:MAG: ABC transporter ATP-binding protein [Candidatus Wallbacteria bacterium]|nr:ABC transporter ATP-binding protein [Candidatus Wallbacteria bacterium]
MNGQRRDPRSTMFGGRGRGMMGLAAPVEKARDFRGTVRRLFGYLKPFRAMLILLAAVIVLNTSLATSAPKILGMAITRLFTGVSAKLAHAPGAAVDFPYIARVLAALALLNIANAAFTYLTQRSMASVALRIVFNLRRDLDEKLSRLPLCYFDSRKHGETMSRITNDVDNISTTVQQGVPQLISSTIGIVGAASMMLMISPLLTLITILTLPLSFLITMFIAKKSQKFYAAQQKALGELNGHVEEMLTGHKVVQAFGYEGKSLQRFSEINERIYSVAWKAQFITGFVFPAMNFVNNLGYALVYVGGGILVVRGRVAIGDMQAFVQYVRMFTQPVAQAAEIVNTLQSSVASAERIFEVLDETEEEPDRQDCKSLPFVAGRLCLENVRFGYTADRILFPDLNLDVFPGQTVAIVGHTGAGKTTLVNLLLRFYEIQGGRISVDGTGIQEIRRGDLRRMFGMVLQDTWLFHGTIRENIAYGKPDATQAEVLSAAEAAQADHYIRTLPDGYETMINEEGTNISQGEKQLLTIARALLADPAILILDEATSSVDTRTELLVQRAMKALMKGRTCFVIAHRLSTIRDAERILVMSEGRIVEQGSHGELLAAGGCYAELYRAQFIGVGI